MSRPLSIALCTIASLSMLGLWSCDTKPSCKRLHERMKKCGADQPAGLTGDRFISLCEERKDRPGVREQIACSKEKRCKAFNACLAKAREKERGVLLERRWREVSKAIDQGDYSKAFTFCDVRQDELKGPMKERCAELPRQAVAALTLELTALRDRGQVPEKTTRCWELKRVALRLGAQARQKADDLCRELEVTRQLVQTRAQVAKVLGGERLFLPYGCQLLRLQEVTKELRSPYTLKVQAELIELCMKKLGTAILAKRVPTQTRCEVRDVYQAIGELGVKDPGLDPLMEQARKHCDPQVGATPKGVGP